MENANVVAISLDSTLLYKLAFEEVYDMKNYKSKLSGTQYLAIFIRSDLLFVQSELAIFVTCSEKNQHAVMKRVLRYIKDTMNSGLLFTSKRTSIYGYSDSDLQDR